MVDEISLVEIRFSDMEKFVREIRDTLLKDTGQLTIPKDSVFQVHISDTEVIKCECCDEKTLLVNMHGIDSGPYGVKPSDKRKG